MRKMTLGLFVTLAALAGCSSAPAPSGKNSTTIQSSDVPAAVQGAFYSEHPYAQINDPQKMTADDGSTQFVIPYTRTDGSKGSATYGDMGDLKDDSK